MKSKHLLVLDTTNPICQIVYHLLAVYINLITLISNQASAVLSDPTMKTIIPIPVLVLSTLPPTILGFGIPTHFRCPDTEDTVPEPSKVDTSRVPVIGLGGAAYLPNQNYLNTHSLVFDAFLDLVDPHPDLRRREIQSDTENNDDAGNTDLVPRDDNPDDDTDLAILAPRASGGIRLFASPNYRAVAAQGAILMLDAADGLAGGALGNAAQVITSINRFWQADHIFELNQLSIFFLRYLKPGAYDYDTIWNKMTTCPVIRQHVTDILNAPANLFGVDSTLNNLKGIFLQNGGPRNIARWEPIVYAGVHEYLNLVRPNYDQTVRKLAVIINHLGGVTADPSQDGPGKVFINWATASVNNALAMSASLTSNAPSPDYTKAVFPIAP